MIHESHRSPYESMSIDDLICVDPETVSTELDVQMYLERASNLVEDGNPALAMLLDTVSAETPDVACAEFAGSLHLLAGRLKVDTHEPALVRACANLLDLWEDDGSP